MYDVRLKRVYEQAGPDDGCARAGRFNQKPLSQTKNGGLEARRKSLSPVKQANQAALSCSSSTTSFVAERAPLFRDSPIDWIAMTSSTS